MEMYRNNYINILIVSSLLCLCCTTTLKAQKRAAANVKFQIGQSYERSADFETAARLYEEAFQGDSSNNIMYDALRRMYMQLKRYDNAIGLMSYWVEKNPNDIGTLTQLGSAYVLNSEEPKAFKVWERAVALDPNHEITYRLVAGAAIQSRLFERAIEYYHRGRNACNDPLLFASDIAYLYSVTLNYREATIEYLNLLRQSSSQLGYIESRIAMYTGRSDGLTIATQTIEEAVKAESNNLASQQLLAWIYMEGNEFEHAYAVYKFLDDQMKAGGRELFAFAEHALREKAYSTAAKAYQEIITKYAKFQLLAQAKFGLARTLEESNEPVDTLKLFGFQNPFSDHLSAGLRKTLTAAIEAYRQVINEFPNTEIAARSLFRIAVVNREKLSDLAGAQSALETLSKNYSNFPAVTAEGNLLLDDIYLIAGNIESARKNYKLLSEQANVASTIRDKATLRLAEIDYYTLKFQDAIGKLNTLTANPTLDITNDALGLKIFIQENNQPSDEALKEFASADFLNRQLKFPEALTQFESIVKKYPQSGVMDEAMMNIGDLQTGMDRFPEAIATYDSIQTQFPESIFLDRAIMKIGLVYQFGLKDKVKAAQAYQKLLELYPNSIFVNDARKRIRDLRGDNI